MIDDNNYSNSYPTEEVEYADRLLKAEIKKLENSVMRLKNEIEELRPKGFLGYFQNNKGKIKEAEQKLIEMENQLIDLQAMTGLDYLIKLKDKEKQSESKSKKMFSTNALNKLSSVAEKASELIPSSVAKIAGKTVSGILKSIDD